MCPPARAPPPCPYLMAALGRPATGQSAAPRRRRRHRDGARHPAGCGAAPGRRWAPPARRGVGSEGRSGRAGAERGRGTHRPGTPRHLAPPRPGGGAAVPPREPRSGPPRRPHGRHMAPGGSGAAPGEPGTPGLPRPPIPHCVPLGLSPPRRQERPVTRDRGVGSAPGNRGKARTPGARRWWAGAA